MGRPTVFVIAFEHGHRAFKCVRLEGSASAEVPSAGAQWIVTMEGRTIWSFDALEDDSRESVQFAVTRWWDERAAVH